jgi:hypothetical protein
MANDEPTILSGDVSPYPFRSPGMESNWVGITRPSGESAVAQLTGGFEMPPMRGWRNNYEAFPEGQEQGELFNLRTPRIQGWFKTHGASSADAMNVLGIAAEESKRRYGSYPQPDETLSEDSARVVSKLTGKHVPTTYLEGSSKRSRANEGNATADSIADSLREAERTGEAPIRRHTEEDLDAGRKLVRTMIAARRGGNKPTTEAPTNPSAVRGKQFKDPNQLELPGI